MMFNIKNSTNKIFFSKMHALGNDFVVIDCINQKFNISVSVIRFLSDRHIGIGFDQLLLIEKPKSINMDFHYRIFNADGQEVEQCGNGARCFAKFVLFKKLTNKKKIHVSTKNRNISLRLIKLDVFEVNMGSPDFHSDSIPLNNTLIKKYGNKLLINDTKYDFSTVSMGNPHCVLQVLDVNNIDVTTIGCKIEKHVYFPKRINVGFMQIINRNYIRLRVYERGVGETTACGSGACAAVAIGIFNNLLSKHVVVELLGGSLNISWKGIGYSLYMTGPATHVYDGYVNI